MQSMVKGCHFQSLGHASYLKRTFEDESRSLSFMTAQSPAVTDVEFVEESE